MEVSKDCCLINLQDEEDGKLYKCMIPRAEYTRIMEGDYNLAIKYLQIQKKNRLLAPKEIVEIKQEVEEEMPSSEIDAQSFCEANLSVDTVKTETQDISEYSESSQLENESWPYNAVIALIEAVAIHQEDLNHPKKKKDIWSKVRNELINKKLKYSEKACYNKWRSLVRSYRSTKEKRNSTGQKATKFMFYNHMDDLLGQNTSIRSGHTSEESEDSTNTKKETKKRKMNDIWTHDAVLALIASVATHYEDLNHPKKKKYVWSKVSNELKSKQMKFSEKACCNRWRSLLSSYRATKKNQKKSTGQEAIRFVFYDQMDDLLGPIHSEQTIESSEEPEASVSEINITDNTDNKKKMNELWTCDAVLALMASIETHHEDLNHPKTKKNVWSKVSKELISKQFTFSENACYNKWRSLLRSYRTTKDKKKSSAQGKTKFMFYDQMDDLLSFMPSIRSGHTMESSEDSGASASEFNNTEDTSNIEQENKKRKSGRITQLKETARQKQHEKRMAVEEACYDTSKTEQENKKRKREPITQPKETARQQRHEKRMVAEEACYEKRQSFMSSYMATKDKKNPGQEVARFMVYDQMDDVLGHMPSIRSGHTIESSEESEASVSEIIKIDITDNTEDATNTEKENKKRKWTAITQLLETAKQKRHEERMAMEEKKIKLEEKKMQLLQKLIDKI